MNSAAERVLPDEMADEAITGMAIPMLVQLRARVEVMPVPMPYEKGLWLIERSQRWLGRHHIETLGYGGSTLRPVSAHCDPGATGLTLFGRPITGLCIHCAPAFAGRLNSLLADQRVSRGHRMTGAGRVEHWEARDPATGVLICWTEMMGGAR